MDLSGLTKKQSGVIFLIVYGLTLVFGLVIMFLGARYGKNFIITMLIADILMTVVIFVVGLIIKNASLYDPYWSVIPFIIILFWAVAFQGFSLSLNSILLIIVVGIWSFRLTRNWWINWTGFAHQDWRYDMLKEKKPKLYPLTNLFGIHLIPTIVVFLQLLNGFDILHESGINIVFLIGVLISLIAPFIQYIADKQMLEFRKNNIDKTKVINTGLWRFSRHPNYFGELIFWIGIYIMYFSYSMSIDLNILYPISMILLFVFISIPMMEKRLASREGYQEYKKSVSMLIPFIQKKK
ncbi:DUF1295 domain-containing protein [Mycoplasmatota bacterium WC30]